MSTGSFEFDQSESTESSGGNYCKLPGKYHFVITGMTPNPSKKNGEPMMNCLQVDMEIIGGTVPSEIGKTFEANFWKGKDTDKDQGEMANLKLTRLSLALGGQHVPRGKGAIDVANAKGRQIVMELAMRVGTDKKERCDVNYANIWHIDDPAVRDVPKDADFIALCPTQFRKFASEIPPQSTQAPSAPSTTTAPSQPQPSLDAI